jgi:tRNA1(Val) A37 N6-methylase TrmN6
MMINTRNPADMTGQERMQEIAAILAAGIQKNHITEQNQCYKRELAGLPPHGKRSCDDAKNQSGGK